MSETDDTDVLLLIPPNFFLVQSSGSEDSLLESSRTVVHKPLSCTAKVLGKLVSQVHTLESRLESLELTSDISSAGTIQKTCDTTDSFDSHSLDRKCFTFPRRRRRKVSKKSRSRELSVTSLDSSSCCRSIPPLKLNKTGYGKPKPVEILNDIQSMDGDISSIVSTPSKKNDKLLLHEIDEFLTKVESYEFPETKFKEQQGMSPERVIKATGDYITQQLDTKSSVDEVKLPSGRVVPSNILDKYIYLVRNSPSSSTQADKQLPSSTKISMEEQSMNHSETTSKLEVEQKQEPKALGVRRLNFSEKEVQPTSTPKRAQTYLDTFRPSSNKIYDRATKVLEQYKSQSYSRNTQGSVTDSYSSPKRDEFKMPQMRPYCPENRDGIKFASLQNKFMDSIDTDLLSLSELWGEKGERGDRVDSVKLEEEKLKREHCEAMIQQLQKKILEQQEKLAVALKVDRAKDAAISKLREAWLKLTGNLDRAEERHRAALDKMVREVENFRIVADDAQKKTNHFEAELYKALDLAHDYQEKCKQLTAEKRGAEERMEKTLASKEEIVNSKEKEIVVLKENYETVMRLNKQATDCVKNLEDALEKEKESHEGNKMKSQEINRQMLSLHDEMSLLTQERDLLREKVNEERARSSVLERQLCGQQNQTSELLRKCDALENEVKSLRHQLETQKNELKVHYQRQLEAGVLAKLQEFQRQLQLAEQEMEGDARGKEAALVETYNRQIQRIEEQHKLEVNVLEEKQREEIKLYRLQLAQASEKVGLLENKLESYRRRRGQIASQLHGVMEAQWRQALRILTGGGAHPAAALDLTRPDSVATVDLAPLRAPPPAPAPAPGPTAHSRRHSDPTAFNFESLSDTDLQQYVKLLLTKPPNLDGSGDSPVADRGREPMEEPTSDRPERHERRDKSTKRCLNSSKPPWKA